MLKERTLLHCIDWTYNKLYWLLVLQISPQLLKISASKITLRDQYTKQ